jgi:tetratricopeptide (TPR) repeat protein
MLDVYKDVKSLPKEIAQVGDRYLEVDNSEKARSLYNQVLDEWPQSEYVLNARAGLIKADIHDGTDTTVMEDINDLITDFNDRRELPNTVFLLGEEYWKQALSENQKTLTSRRGSQIVQNDKANDCYMKAQVIWEKIINGMSGSPNMSMAYRMAAEACRSSGQLEKSLQYYQKFIEKWPDDDFASHCQFMVCTIYQSKLSKGIISEKEAYKLMKTGYDKMVQNYPDNPQVKTIHTWIKDYENKYTPKSDAQQLEEAMAFIKSYEDAKKQGARK